MGKSSRDAHSRKIASAGLNIGSIKLNPKNPFEWASGFIMPIYNDNRMFLFYPECREVIDHAFDYLVCRDSLQSKINVIAGTSTAGIPWADAWSRMFDLPQVYVRDKPKGHGLRNQIEGIDAESNLKGYKVLLIEDLISTGGSSVKAVQAVRDAKGTCDYCVSIFSYGFDEAKKMFTGELPYDKEDHKLTSPCDTKSLLTYNTLLEVAREEGFVNKQEIEMLEKWREDPWNWGEKHGFSRIEK